MTSGNDPRAEAEAAAERLMAQARLMQSIETSHVRYDGRVTRLLAIVALALVGAVLGGVMGALRGHVASGALLMAILGGLLAAIQTRAR